MIYIIATGFKVGEVHCSIDLNMDVRDPNVRLVTLPSQLRGAKISAMDEVHWVGDWTTRSQADKEEMELMVKSRSNTR
jgi:hypothetical protein